MNALNAAKTATANVHQDEHEPEAGRKGAGTKEQPFDAGNEDEQKTAPKTEVGEPQAGVKGAGTKSEPFDQGNSGSVNEPEKHA